MDLSRYCLNKKNEFGVLWSHGCKELGKDGRIGLLNVEELDAENLLKFILIHEEVIEYEQLTILFKGFFMIMFNKFESIHNKFNHLKSEILISRRPKISDFSFAPVLDDRYEQSLKRTIDETIESIELSSTRKSKKQKEAITLIKEVPSLALNDPVLDIVEDLKPLAGDGFGGDVNQKANVVVNLDELYSQYFDTYNLAGTPIKRFASKKVEERVAERAVDNQSVDQEITFDDSNLTAAPAVPEWQDDYFEDDGILDDGVPDDGVPDDTILDQPQGEDLLADNRRSMAHSLRSEDNLSISERQPDQLQVPVAETSIELSSVHSSEALKIRRRSGSSNKRSRSGLIIDKRIRLKGSMSKTKFDHKYKSVMEDLIPARILFSNPLIPNRIPTIASLNFYQTEQHKTVEMRKLKLQADQSILNSDQLSLDGSNLSSINSQSQDYLQKDPIHSGGFPSPIDQISSNLLSEIINQVSINLSEDNNVENRSPRDSRRRPFDNSSKDYSSNIEMQRGSLSTSRPNFSDFEPLNLQSDYTASNRLPGIQDSEATFDLDSFDFVHPAAVHQEESRSKDMHQEESRLKELEEESTKNLFDIGFSELILKDLDLKLEKRNRGENVNVTEKFYNFTSDFKRADAARVFFDLLRLKDDGIIEMKKLSQDFYSDILYYRI